MQIPEDQPPSPRIVDVLTPLLLEVLFRLSTLVDMSEILATRRYPSRASESTDVTRLHCWTPHNSDVAADVALSRCAPSGPRS
jgi:hypothetical protein